MRDSVSRVATILAELPSLTDVEDIARKQVLSTIHKEERLLTGEEMETIVNDTVEGETVVDQPFIEEMSKKRVHSNQYKLSSIERASLSSDDIYIDSSGAECVSIANRMIPVAVYEDTRVATILERIQNDMTYALAALAVEGYENIDPYELEAPALVCCPDCGSDNVTPVWEDGEIVTSYCNDCDLSFVNMDGTSMREDYDIFDGCFGTISPTVDGWAYEIWIDGEIADAGTLPDVDDILEYFDVLSYLYTTFETENVLVAGEQFEVTTREEKIAYTFKGANEGITTVPKEVGYACEANIGDVYADPTYSFPWTLKISAVQGDNVEFRVGYLEDLSTGETQRLTHTEFFDYVTENNLEWRENYLPA